MSENIDVMQDVSNDEKVLIKSERYSVMKAVKILLKIFVALLLIGGILAAGGAIRYNSLKNKVPLERKERYHSYGLYSGYYYDLDYDTSSEEYDKWCHSFSGTVIAFGLVLLCGAAGTLVVAIILLLIEWSFKNAQLIITDKRSFGIRKFTKRVDLPLDSISAVSTRGKHALRISTSSGLIIFSMIKNRDDMHKVLTDLLVERQNKKNEPEVKINPVETVVKSSDADELTKFKKLLDDGVITQEEFDAKKKQILGL